MLQWLTLAAGGEGVAQGQEQDREDQVGDDRGAAEGEG